MGNQTVSHFNPCSEIIPIEPKLSSTIRKTKVPSYPKLHKMKNEIMKSSALKPPNLLKTQTFCPQLSVSLSTEESELKNLETFNPLDTLNFTNHSHSIKINQNSENHFKHKKVEKIFIFDWDDTLFFSTHIRGLAFPIKKSQVIQQSIRLKIDQNVSKILKFCVDHGQVHIVTNSKEGWVKYSSQKFLPKTSSILFQNSKIKVISTLLTQQEIFLFPEPSKCKYAAFKNILQEITPKPPILRRQDLHIICIGDSQEQIDATNQIYNEYHHQYKNLYTKTIKFEDFPNAQDLLEEQQLLYQKLQMISDVNTKLIIKIKRPVRLNSQKIN